MTTKPADKDDGAEVAGVTKKRKAETGLPDEIAELVNELRETVKRIDPRKHTPRTLRRALSTASDILADIDRLTA